MKKVKNYVSRADLLPDLFHPFVRYLQDRGYFLRLSADYAYDLSDRLGETEERVQEIIDFCLQVDLFNRQKYDLYKIITSKSIQERYILAQKRCKNPVCEEFDCINVSKAGVNVAETTENTTKSAHIILDYIKVNNTINNACESACEREAEIVEKGFDEKCALSQEELLKDGE